MRKPWKLLAMLPFLPLTIPAVLIIRALRPLVLIRFSPFNSEVIGIFAGATEMYLCQRDAGLDNRQAFDIFYHNRQPCSQQLRKMWDRTLHVSRLAGPVDMLNRALPGGKAHVIRGPEYDVRDIDGLMLRTPAHLSFTPEEERLGREELRVMGVPEGASFVCFHSRDSEYKRVVYPDRDLRPYNYRDSNIHNHVPAAEEMTRRGYYAIRTGAIVEEPLQTANPMIIDYATKHRSDFMDIYLCSKCYFSIGDQCGLCLVPPIFRRPAATVNVIPVEGTHSWDPYNVFIPKKLWLGEEGRFLKFGEVFDRRVNVFYRTEQYEQAGIEPVENTAEEITALAVEMDERLKGTWQTTEEDEELQRRFWSQFRPDIKEVMHGVIKSHIGAEFLRRNRELLD